MSCKAGPAPETVTLYERLRAQGRQEPAVRPAGRMGGRFTLMAAIRGRQTQPADVLEPVGGAMPLDSLFYVTRPADAQFRDAVARRDSIVLVKGPRQVGKTSLLARGLQAAREAGARVVHTDFQELNSEHLVSTETLLRALATALADRLDLDASPGERLGPGAWPEHEHDPVPPEGGSGRRARSRWYGGWTRWTACSGVISAARSSGCSVRGTTGGRWSRPGRGPA